MVTTVNLRSCLGRIDRPVGFCATAVEQPILPGLSIDGFGSRTGLAMAQRAL